MPLFTFICRDKPQSFDLRAATREAHLAYWRDRIAAVKLGGPWIDGEGRSIGSLLIVEALDEAQAQALLAADPYVTAGLFASTAIEPWKLTLGAFAEPA